jgi:hypothetical protein
MIATLSVIASSASNEAIIYPLFRDMDCFAEPVITARAQLRSSSGADSRDPVARNDGGSGASPERDHL